MTTMNDLIKERRLRRIQIDPEWLIEWFRDVSMLRGDLSWPVLEGLPHGYQVVHAGSTPLSSPTINLIIAHPSFSPCSPWADIPRFEGPHGPARFSIPLTAEQVKILADAGHPVRTRKPKLL